jgi:hypothetical protein
VLHYVVLDRAGPTNPTSQPTPASQPTTKKNMLVGHVGRSPPSRYVAVLRLEGLRVPFEPSNFANRFVLTNVPKGHQNGDVSQHCDLNAWCARRQTCRGSCEELRALHSRTGCRDSPQSVPGLRDYRARTGFVCTPGFRRRSPCRRSLHDPCGAASCRRCELKENKISVSALVCDNASNLQGIVKDDLTTALGPRLPLVHRCACHVVQLMVHDCADIWTTAHGMAQEMLKQRDKVEFEVPCDRASAADPGENPLANART